MRDAFISGLIDLARNDESVALLTGDLGFGVVEKFADKYPDRFWNCGVAEQSMLSIAAGMAKSGLRPFVYSIANFPTFRCLEQIRNDVCYHDLPVTIVSVGGGLGYGTLGYTHHGIEDVAALRALPNINIYSPADPIQTREVLSHIYEQSKPAYLRLGKNGEPVIENFGERKISGCIQELKSGKDLTVISCGAITDNCLNVANQLQNKFDIQVISISKIQPLDIEFISKITDSTKIVIVEEHVERGGLAAAILEGFNKIKMSQMIHHVYVQERHISQTGSQEYLRGLSGLDKPGLSKTFLNLIETN